MARKDYKKICENLDKLSTNAKRSFKRQFQELLIDLENMPFMYQCFDSNIDTNIRRVVIKKNIVFYKITKDNKIIILRILPEKYDYLNQLDKYKILIRK